MVKFQTASSAYVDEAENKGTHQRSQIWINIAIKAVLYERLSVPVQEDLKGKGGS